MNCPSHVPIRVIGGTHYSQWSLLVRRLTRLKLVVGDHREWHAALAGCKRCATDFGLDHQHEEPARRKVAERNPIMRNLDLTRESFAGMEGTCHGFSWAASSSVRPAYDVTAFSCEGGVVCRVPDKAWRGIQRRSSCDPCRDWHRAGGSFRTVDSLSTHVPPACHCLATQPDQRAERTHLSHTSNLAGEQLSCYAKLGAT